MSAASSRIPPLNKIYIISSWVSASLWGVNTVVFLAVCYVLFCTPNSRYNRWFLGGTSLMLYACVTIHVAASLRQQLQAFVFTPADAPPSYAILYFANEGAPLAVMKNIVYTTAVFIQDLVLIWRMYIVWGQSFKAVVVPLVVECAHIGVAYAGAIILSRPDAGIYSPVINKLGKIGWPLELVVNVTVTAAIASRLWYMGYKVSRVSSSTSGFTTKGNVYAAPVFTMVESGAILVAVTVLMTTLYNVGNPRCGNTNRIPYLIIVRVGLGLTHGLPSAYKMYLETGGITEISFAMNHLGSQNESRTQAGWSTTEQTASFGRAGCDTLSESKAAIGSQEAIGRPVE